MIVKAYITELPETGENEFKVRIPYLEGNSNKEVIYSALLCNQPGEYGGYKVGDCVFVGFEENELDTPIIFGKLYVKEEDDVPTTLTVSSLNVTGDVTLPATTEIGGYSTLNIFKNSQKESSGTTIIEASGLDYDIIEDTISDTKYDTFDTWPYDESQEQYCKVSYLVDDITYEDYVEFNNFDYDIVSQWTETEEPTVKVEEYEITDVAGSGVDE